METKMETTERPVSKNRHKPETQKAWRSANPPVQLRVERKLREAMVKRAKEECLSLAAWVRRAMTKELRRKPLL